jgi:signal peptidase I
MLVVVLSTAVHFVTIRYWGFTAVINGTSMEPTYHHTDKVWVNCFSLLSRDPIRGEIVIIKNPIFGSYDIKRIAGIPGDDIGITNGKKYHLRNEQYFVLGDNTKNSMDSREYGPVLRKQIIGVVK